MNAKETIINIIRCRVAVMNAYCNDSKTWERLRAELVGMMICLKNIANADEIYCINYYDNGKINFGYYDKDGKWYTIEQ